MAKRKKELEDVLFPPLWVFILAVPCLLVSIAFWSTLVSIDEIHTREDAKHSDTYIASWEESGSGLNRDLLLINCSDGNLYYVRQVQYAKHKNELQSALSSGAEASIYSTNYKDIIELTINGNTIISFEEGYDALHTNFVGYAVIGAFFDACGVMFIIYGFWGIKRIRLLKKLKKLYPRMYK